MAIPAGTRRQLVAFAVITVVAVSTVCVRYLELPRLLGFGQFTVSVELEKADGLHAATMVNYRGVPVGRIEKVDLTRDGARAILRIDDDARVPADTRVEVHSTSAAGEQYLDLVPRADRPPYLADGAVIRSADVTPLPSTDQLLSGVGRLARSVSAGDTNAVLDELSLGFGGSVASWRRLIDSIATISADAERDLGAITTFLDQAEPFLRTQQAIMPDLQSSFADLDPATQTLAQSAGELRELLVNGPPALAEFTGLLSGLQPDVAAILRDLTSTGQVVKTYLPGVEQILVLYPATAAALQGATGPQGGADPSSVHLAFRPNVNQPPSCLSGFLPLKDQRDFRDERVRTSVFPDLYCHAPASDVRDVRGARNTPCFNVPGRRAASVEQCLGREIGTISDPLPPSQRTLGSYSLRTGRALDDNGRTFLLGSSGGTSIETLQELFTG